MLGSEKLPPGPLSPALLPVGVAGVEEFLDETKDRADQDPEYTPFDDLRHYAYEGDGELSIYVNVRS